MDGNSACVGTGETKEVGKGAGGCLFDYGEGGGDMVDVDVGVEDGEN